MVPKVSLTGTSPTQQTQPPEGNPVPQLMKSRMSGKPSTSVKVPSPSGSSPPFSPTRPTLSSVKLNILRMISHTFIRYRHHSFSSPPSPTSTISSGTSFHGGGSIMKTSLPTSLSKICPIQRPLSQLSHVHPFWKISKS